MLVRAVLFSILFLGLISITMPAFCQKTETPLDSSATPRNTYIVQTDSSALDKTEKDKGLSKPGRAALYSAIIPGAGQFYNKHYWKVPVVYAVIGTLGYFVYTNNNEYQSFNRAFKSRAEGNKDDEHQKDYPSPQGDLAVRNLRDFYHNNRDLSIIFTILAYGLNVVEANVGAHLNEYDISDDLSMRIQPNIQYSYFGSAPVTSLTLNFRLKN